MARTKISEFSATAASNTDIDSINIAEGCAPSGINDAIRELMSQLKDWQSGTSNDPYVVGSSGSLTLNQGTANGIAYLNGSKVVTSGSALTFDGTSVTASQFLDTGFTLADNTDITKKAVFELSGLTTATTRTYTLPDATGTVALLSGSQTFSGVSTFSSTFTLSATTSTLSLGNLQTTGTFIIGGTGGTGTITLGRSTATQTTNIQAGATASGSTKTINFGTGGLSGSTTAITIGSSVSGASSTTTLNGTVALANALPTTSGGTGLTSFTANGVVYASSSSALATGSALVFDGTNLGVGTSSPNAKLSVQGGNFALQSTTTSGSTSVGYLSGYSDKSGSNYEIGRIDFQTGNFADAGQMLFSTRVGAGSLTEKMRLDSSGNLGIGTSSPAYKLDVRGVIVGGDGSVKTAISYSGGAGVIGTLSNNPVAIYTNTNEVARFDTSGNLGLGVTPSAWGSGQKAIQIGSTGVLYNPAVRYLSLGSNFYDNGSNGIYLTTGYATIYQQNRDSGVHAWYTAPSGTAGNAITFTQAMTLDASGNLGVGTTNTTPANGTGMVVGSAGTIARIDMRNSTTGLASGDGTSFYLNGNDFTIENRETGFVAFATSSTESARIDSSGNLLVGTTAVGSWGANCWGVQTGSGFTVTGHANGTSSGQAFAYFDYNNNPIGSITQSGTTAVLYNVTSDQRLKENIQDSDSASALIDSLQVRKFDWKTDQTHQRYGFIAQELVTVAPEAVHQPADAEEMMAVDYSKLVPMLVKEIQSLRKRLAALEAK